MTTTPTAPIPDADAPVTDARFTRMDESTAEQWGVIAVETIADQPRVAESVLGMLGGLRDVTVGFAVDQLTHCLQTATLAERAGADTEVVVASLCHDIGKAISVPNHPRIAAEILRPYVREEVRWMIEVHQDFQGRHYYHHLGGDPTAGQVPRARVVRARRALRRRVGPDRVRPRLRHAPARALRGPGARGVRPTRTCSDGHTTEWSRSRRTGRARSASSRTPTISSTGWRAPSRSGRATASRCRTCW